jgi:spore germination cell wall hydrolase CwlJ-like protein
VLSSKALRRLALVRHLPGGERERALRCLAFVAWAEARSDGLSGMAAVVAVVLNRSRSPSFPVHPCEVIGQPGAFEPVLRERYRTTALALKRRVLAPFPRPRNPVDAAALRQARLMVWQLAQQRDIRDPTRGATHFVAPRVLKARGQAMPAWTRSLVRTAVIGGHHFFRSADLRLAEAP